MALSVIGLCLGAVVGRMARGLYLGLEPKQKKTCSFDIEPSQSDSIFLPPLIVGWFVASGFWGDIYLLVTKNYTMNGLCDLLSKWRLVKELIY